MAFQYFCDNHFRAQRFRSDQTITLNGIDYVEVVDSESPVEALRQRTLLVRLFRPVPPLAPENIRIEGGVRIDDIGIEWVGAASDAATLRADGLIGPAEEAYFLGLPEPDHLLLVRTDSDGDFSIYTLTLVASLAADEPPAGFDPILNQLTFSFKVECPVDFDCAPEDDCPPEPLPTPVINYLAKDYTGFRQLILDRLAVTNPDWQETHVPDLNIALVELLAYAGDYLSYFQDSVATEAYLGRARRRISVRRHARLLSYPMHDGSNARTWAVLTAADGIAGVELAPTAALAEPPLQLLTRMPAEGRLIPPEEIERVISQHRPQVFELQTPVTLYTAHNTINFYTWGDEACCLPAGATEATLLSSVDPAAALHLQSGDVLIFEELINPQTGLRADADLSHRQAVRLTAVEPSTDPLDGVPVVHVRWDPADALTFALTLSFRQDGLLFENAAVARGNVALADHGRTLTQEPLAAKSGHRRYRPLLRETDVTFAAPVDNHQPAAITLAHDPQVALPQIELWGDGERWTPQRDLLESGQFSANFVVESENDGRAYLRFGDGLYGNAPSDQAFSGPGMGATYRIGSGPAGNIGADTLYHVSGPDVSAIAGVRNPLSAAGGQPPESLEEVRQYAPQAFRRQERAVTPEDYAEVTERHPAVQRAVATRRWTGSWYTMFVTIDRAGGFDVTPEFEEEIRLHLEKYRLAGHDVEINGPHFVPLDIRLTVCLKAGFYQAQIKEQLLAQFSSRRLSTGEPGFFHPDRFTFGQPVYLSEIVATVMGITGVQWVDYAPSASKDHRFRRWGQAPNQELQEGVITFSRLEIAQLENDPSRPESGRIEFYLEGGLS